VKPIPADDPGPAGRAGPGKPLAAGHVAGSAKHFLADGGTDGGKDQGDALVSEAELVRLHAQAIRPAIDAGILTVMASFSSWNGVKITGNKSLLTDVLKGRMGFEGFVVGDWNAHGQVRAAPTPAAPGLNAGLDMYMAPDSWKGLYDNTLAQVKSGEIPMARLDDAVRRILRVKVKAGPVRAQAPAGRQVRPAGRARAPRRGPRGRAQVAGAAEERRRPAAEERPTCWWPATGPTTSARPPAAGP
jgi:beta-glucosidase